MSINELIKDLEERLYGEDGLYSCLNGPVTPEEHDAKDKHITDLELIIGTLKEISAAQSIK
jgi:hypothetical protein